MKKILFALSLITAVILVSIPASAIDIYINGEKIQYTDSTGYPIYENDTVLVPLYTTAESFGANVIQDNPNGTVLVKYGTTTVSASTDENAIYRNGVKIPSAAGLVWQGGPLYVPLALFEELDAEVFVSGSTVTVTKKENNDGELRLYAASYDKSYRGSKHFGAKYEPQCGIYLGAQYDTAAGETLHSEKSAAGLLVYADAENPIQPHSGLLTGAAESGKLVQYVLCDKSFSEISTDKEKYIRIAQSLEKSGAKIFFRLSAKNTASTDTYEYAEKFRIISDIFRTHAPSVALVWEVPTDTPAESVLATYPGDRYLDYVGAPVSLDGSGEAPLTALDIAVSLFSYKKPIIVTEAASSLSFGEELLEFYTYLPIRYPQVKAVFLREPNTLGTAALGDYLAMYSAGTVNPAYLRAANANTENTPCYFELANNVTVPPSAIRLYSFAQAQKPEISHITYLINGEQAGSISPTTVPYETEIDFSPFAGQTVLLEIRAFDKAEQPFAEKTCKIKVSSVPSSDNRIGGKAIPVTNALAALGISLIGLFAVALILKKLKSIF